MAPPLDEYEWVIGVDEVGFGAWAGPLVVCAAAIRKDWKPPPKLTDSKKLSRAEHQRIVNYVDENPDGVWWKVFIGDVKDIDSEGVGKVLARLTAQAVKEATQHVKGSHIAIVDGNKPIPGATSIPKADSLVPAVSLASCIAKHVRDEEMVILDQKYRGYGFASNSGYGTKAHEEAIQNLGLCPIHRRSYGPIKRFAAMEIMKGMLGESERKASKGQCRRG